MCWLSPAAFIWLLPATIPLLLSIPLSVYFSRATVGRALRRGGGSFKYPAVLEELRAQLQKPETSQFRLEGFHPPRAHRTRGTKANPPVMAPIAHSLVE